MRILITGGAGFVGSNLAIKFKKQYPKYEIICFDNLKRRGSELNLTKFKELNIEFIHGDIRLREDLEQVSNLDVLIDASAEPSVLAGLNSGTESLLNNNLWGTINCMELAKKENALFVFLSTSRVYPIENINNIPFIETSSRFEINENINFNGCTPQGLTENFSLKGHRSFYGASKLSSELIIEEYKAFCNLKMVINRCGVITGPRQMGKIDQGVVVLWLARHLWKQKLGYFGYGGEGKQVRDILHVDDLFRLIDWQIMNIDKINGEIFNVGGGRNCSVSLKELTMLCEEITRNKISISKHEEDRVADIRIYLTDNSKITDVSGWVPKYTPKEILSEIFEWMIENEKQLKYIIG